MRRHLGLLIFIPLAVGWLATSGQAFAAQVSFLDLHPQDAEHLRQVLPHLSDGTADQATMDDAIRVLMRQGTYENVFVERDSQGNFEIIGKPLRIVEEIKFNGVREVSEADLRDLLEIKTGDRFDRKKAVASGEKMKTFYGEHGFFNTVIELNFQKTEKKNIRLVFDVQEKAPCIVQGLVFNTPNVDLKKLLEAKFKWIMHKPLTTDNIHRFNQDLISLMIERRYLATEVIGPDAKYNPEKTAAYLQVEVREPYRWEFYFSGNKKFSTVDVYRALDLGNKERKNVDPASEGAERLRRAYLEKGYPNVQIETRVESAALYLKRVYYTINEGPRVKIKEIQVQGRISRPPQYYANFIMKNSSDLVEGGYYNRAALDNGFKNLVTQLRNEGYLRAKVLSSRIEYNDRKDKVTVFVLLEEGPQTQIRAIDFTGNKFFSSFELREVTELEINTALHLNKFEESLGKLKDFYHNQGFIEMRLLNEGDQLIQYNDTGTQANIKFQIYEGPRVRVHAIVIEGNTLTKQRVILKETDFRLGEVLTPQKVDEATARLNKMGLFSRVDIRTAEEGTNIAERTLVISVTEVDPGLFSFGGGVTSERNLTVRGFAAATYNNLLGTARAVSLRGEVRDNPIEVKYPETDLTAGYFEPFLLDTRTRGRVTLTRSQYVYNYQILNDGEQYTEITTKNRLATFLERDLTRHTKLTYRLWSLESRLDYERNGICVPTDLNATPDPTKRVGSGCDAPTPMQVALTGPQFDIDYRDNPFMPTKGTYTRLSMVYSDPMLGSSPGVQFIKIDGSFTHHKRLGDSNVIWANSFGTGYLANMSHAQDSGVPSDYAYVLGGIYTVRGYTIASENERIPRDGDGVDAAHPNGFILGATNQKLITGDSHFFLVKSELRFPIVGNWGGVLFYDGGAVFVSGYTFDHPYKDSIGFGFRYNTPVGPAAFDFAFKLHPEGPSQEETDPQTPFRFTFTIGTF